MVIIFVIVGLLSHPKYNSSMLIDSYDCMLNEGGKFQQSQATRTSKIIVIVIVIVIVNSKLLKRHSKAKRRAPAYSRALRQIRGVFQRIVRGRLRSVFQRVRECVKSEVFSKE